MVRDTTLKPLAYVRDVTGKHIHLGMFESCIGLRTHETSMVLGINRAKVRETGRRYYITKRGTTLYTFELTPQGWTLTDTLTVWWSTDELVDRFPSSSII